jgi:F-type H+-transporting ATPase subunit c
MKSKLAMLGTGLLAIASPIFAQGSNVPLASDHSTAAAYLAVGIASGLCGLGQGRAVASSAEAMARNPGATAGIRFALILGLILIESLALYALVASFIVKR